MQNEQSCVTKSESNPSYFTNIMRNERNLQILISSSWLQRTLFCQSILIIDQLIRGCIYSCWQQWVHSPWERAFLQETRSQQVGGGRGNTLPSGEPLEETNTPSFVMNMLLIFQEFRLVSLQLIHIKNIFLEMQQQLYLPL